MMDSPDHLREEFRHRIASLCPGAQDSARRSWSRSERRVPDGEEDTVPRTAVGFDGVSRIV
ncbi:hypothetical protein trd_1561 [Thermomicrobium roseum DSM 5159]|uniref:Uncharacterized protein n=1 Tax=Thermomicrobium roseum (strain ATCC 27502 / DSM 5159 / P-2) TaxID=309801 RepID=B9L068_THERP|nr:hypothetical protein trd_1561 [Thermomicrobium roseum DSM 5159]